MKEMVIVLFVVMVLATMLGVVLQNAELTKIGMAAMLVWLLPTIATIRMGE
jgi:hypothetical protein